MFFLIKNKSLIYNKNINLNKITTSKCVFIICYLFFLVQSSPNLTKSLFFDSQVGAFLKIEIAHHAPEMIENL